MSDIEQKAREIWRKSITGDYAEEEWIRRIAVALQSAVAEEREELHNLEVMLRYATRNRCAVCGWPLAASANEGCIQGNCSYAAHHNPDWAETYSRRAKLLDRIMSHNQQPPENLSEPARARGQKETVCNCPQLNGPDAKQHDMECPAYHGSHKETA